MSVSAVKLESRALIHLGGADAETLMQGLITFDMDRLKTYGGGFGALLTPQGKVMFDFFVLPFEGGFLLDTHGDVGADLLKRMTMYKLRADVQLKDMSEELSVVSVMGTSDAMSLSNKLGACIADPRHIGLGYRLYVPFAETDSMIDEMGAILSEQVVYTAKRIELAVPEAPMDYAYGEVFPHDINLDQINAIGFDKGCFVGQEVVSRVKHRGSARKRIVMVSSAEMLPEPGTDIQSEKKSIGRLGSVDNHNGLALVRLDKVNDALESGHFINAGSARLTPALPEWVSFSWV